MTFFQCFDGTHLSSALLSADVRGSRPKATERGMKAIITLLYSMRCASSSQCRPPPCVPLRARLAGAPSLPCEVSARGCCALHPSSLPPSCCGKCTHVTQALPLCLLLLSKRKAKNAATRDTHRSTRTAQHFNTPRSSSGRSECRERRGRQGKAVRAQRALRR